MSRVIHISIRKGKIMTARTTALLHPSLPALRRRSFFAPVLDLMALYRQRQRLAELPDHLLDDLGLTRESAREEATRPLWDAPGHWRR